MPYMILTIEYRDYKGEPKDEREREREWGAISTGHRRLLQLKGRSALECSKGRMGKLADANNGSHKSSYF